MGGNPGELVKNAEKFSIRADCMCNRRFCTHAAWREVPYGENQVKDNWAFRYVMKAPETKPIDPGRKP